MSRDNYDSGYDDGYDDGIRDSRESRRLNVVATTLLAFLVGVLTVTAIFLVARVITW